MKINQLTWRESDPGCRPLCASLLAKNLHFGITRMCVYIYSAKRNGSDYITPARRRHWNTLAPVDFIRVNRACAQLTRRISVLQNNTAIRTNM